MFSTAIGPDGKPWLSLAKACDELGINPDSQRKKLKTKPWATAVMITSRGSDGKQREMMFISENTVPMWLATINGKGFSFLHFCLGTQKIARFLAVSSFV
ncbi:MAG: hypothetical protein GY822_00900 [Deltaproteobacteria bacterium]|nr:hypothetical protein [Deltaproteobacteria bacterium]